MQETHTTVHLFEALLAVLSQSRRHMEKFVGLLEGRENMPATELIAAAAVEAMRPIEPTARHLIREALNKLRLRASSALKDSAGPTFDEKVAADYILLDWGGTSLSGDHLALRLKATHVAMPGDPVHVEQVIALAV
jgi:hypothetical protein